MPAPIFGSRLWVVIKWHLNGQEFIAVAKANTQIWRDESIAGATLIFAKAQGWQHAQYIDRMASGEVDIGPGKIEIASLIHIAAYHHTFVERCLHLCLQQIVL